MSAEPSSPRVYGNWHKPRSPGLWGFGALSLGLLMSGVVLSIVVLLKSTIAGALCLLATMVVVLPMRVRDRYGRDLWQRARGPGGVEARSGEGPGPLPVGTPGQDRSGHPRPAGPRRGHQALDAFDGLGPALRPAPPPRRRPGDRRHRDLGRRRGAARRATRSTPGWPSGASGWPRSAPSRDSSGVAVTVEASPDSGVRLRREVEGRLAPGRPRSPPRSCGRSSTSTRRDRPRSPAGSRSPGRWPPGSKGAGRAGSRRWRSRSATGCPSSPRPWRDRGGPGRPMTVGELAAAFRVAYDPGVHAWVEEAATTGTGSPVTTAARGHRQYDSDYRHDGGVLGHLGDGRGPAGPRALERAGPGVGPHPEIARKRVTLLYRMHDPAEAAQVVEQDFRDAVFNKSSAKGLQVGTTPRGRPGERTADEEARGAGLALFALLVTATVTDEERARRGRRPRRGPRARRTPGAAAELGHPGGGLRRGLPLGLVLPHHLAVPRVRPGARVSDAASPAVAAGAAGATEARLRRPGRWPGRFCVARPRSGGARRPRSAGCGRSPRGRDRRWWACRSGATSAPARRCARTRSAGSAGRA